MKTAYVLLAFFVSVKRMHETNSSLRQARMRVTGIEFAITTKTPGTASHRHPALISSPVCKAIVNTCTHTSKCPSQIWDNKRHFKIFKNVRWRFIKRSTASTRSEGATHYNTLCNIGHSKDFPTHRRSSLVKETPEYRVCSN